jgi:glutathione synthase/RimK-type ligase-like ATP-grasp enzyme
MKPYILVLTHVGEVNVDILIPLLEKRGSPVIRVNTDQFPIHMQLSLFLEKGTPALCLENGLRLSTENVKSCWRRQPWLPLAKNLSKGYEQLIKKESQSFLWSLVTTLDVFWMNHPISAHILEDNKLFQMQEACRVGLRIPDSLMTNKKDEALAFCEAHGGVIALKLISGVVFQSKEKLFDCVYTQKLSYKDLLSCGDQIAVCPIFIQEYVPKKVEARITVVGDSIFPCVIHSQDSQKTRDDWRRYDFANVKHEKIDIPQEISKKLLLFMKNCNISFGAFDFIITPEDEYVFLEVNQGGQWGWIEELTGMPISEAIADVLSAAC